MGGNTFMVTGNGSNANTVFNALTEQDRYENGHSYSGGIGMKDGFVRIATVDSLDAAYQLADQLIDDADPRIDDKWGPAGCIEVVLPTAVDAPKVRKNSAADQVFRALRLTGETMTTKELAELTKKSPVTVGRYAGKLVASGHLVRDGKGFKVATRPGAASGERTFVFFGWASS